MRVLACTISDRSRQHIFSGARDRAGAIPTAGPNVHAPCTNTNAPLRGDTTLVQRSTHIANIHTHESTHVHQEPLRTSRNTSASLHHFGPAPPYRRAGPMPLVKRPGQMPRQATEKYAQATAHMLIPMA